MEERSDAGTPATDGGRPPDSWRERDAGPERAGDRPGRRPGDAAPESRLKTIALVVGLAVAGFVVGIVLIQVVGTLVFGVLGVPATDVVGVVLALVVLQGIAFPLVALGFLRYRGLSLSFLRIRLPPTRRDLAWAFGGYVVAFVLVLAAVTAVSTAGAPTAERSDQQVLQQPQVLLALIPLSFLLIGPGEELLFRGVIQGALREVFPAPAAIVLASATFAPAHIVSLQGGVQALAVSIGVLFLPSLVFGYAFERTGNLVVPSLCHGAYNATLFGLLYLAITSGQSPELLLP